MTDPVRLSADEREARDGMFGAFGAEKYDAHIPPEKVRPKEAFNAGFLAAREFYLAARPASPARYHSAFKPGTVALVAKANAALAESEARAASEESKLRSHVEIGAGLMGPPIGPQPLPETGNPSDDRKIPSFDHAETGNPWEALQQIIDAHDEEAGFAYGDDLEAHVLAIARAALANRPAGER